MEEFVHPRQLNRRSGRTTRAVDEMVQHLFNHGVVMLWDHADGVDSFGNWNMALKQAKHTFFNRLSNEHHLTVKNGLDYDQEKETVRLKNHPKNDRT